MFIIGKLTSGIFVEYQSRILKLMKSKIKKQSWKIRLKKSSAWKLLIRIFENLVDLTTKRHSEKKNRKEH